MSVQTSGGDVGGMMPHHPLIPAIPNSVIISLSCNVVTTTGVWITSCGGGGIPGRYPHICCGCISSIPMVVLRRCFNHALDTGSCVNTPVELKMFDPVAPKAICSALRHHPRHIFIVSGTLLIPASLITSMIFLCRSHGLRCAIGNYSTRPAGIKSNTVSGHPPSFTLFLDVHDSFVDWVVEVSC